MKTYFVICSLMFGLVTARAEKPVARELSVIVTAEGFYPRKITAFQGERVKFFVTSTVEGPECFLLQGHKVFLSAQKGKLAEADVSLETPGDFSFYCPASKHTGTLTVLRRSEQRPARAVAAEKDPGPWTPREYE